MLESRDVKFLLDENVSNNLRKFLISKKYDVITVQELNKKGVKNSELLELARKKNRILLTYEKNFIEFMLQNENFLFLIDIHPLVDENVFPNFEKFLDSFSFEKLIKNVVILGNDGITLKKK